MLTIVLESEGMDPIAVADGNDAVPAFHKHAPELILLDLMLPGMNGVDICRAIRHESAVPIVMLTAKTDTVDVVLGLESGADDYITKPFSLEEVITRLRVVLRRGNVQEDTAEDSSISYADLTLNDDTHEVTKGGELIELSPTEFNLLRFLMLNKEVVLSKAKILDNVWHYDFGGDGNVVESYISYLRRKIDTGDTPLIHTVRGVGYVLRKPRR